MRNTTVLTVTVVASVVCFLALFYLARSFVRGQQASLLNLRGSATQNARSDYTSPSDAELNALGIPMYCCKMRQSGESCTLVDSGLFQSCGATVEGEFQAGEEFQVSEDGYAACKAACAN